MLERSYTFDEAVAEGVLIDVTDIAAHIGLPWPIAMSVALWNSNSLKGKEENLMVLVSYADVRARDQFQTDEQGYLTFGAYFGMSGAVRVRIRVVRDATGEVSLLILLMEEEEFDLRCPRSPAASFYTM